MTEDPYEVLGVPETVTLAELKKAYHRKIKQHPPETDPEGFMRVQRAYETASDPEYPTVRRHGEEIRTLMNEADDRMAAEDWPEAVRRLKRVIVLHSGHLAAWNLLGICHTNTADWAEAKKAYARLLKLAPDSALFRRNAAYVYISEAGSIDDDPASEARLAQEGRDQLAPALAAEPENADVLDTYARTFACESNWAAAADWTERAIRAEKGGPTPDRYLYLARMYHLAGREGEVFAVADRLAAQLPDDPNSRKAGAGKFARFALEVYKAHLFTLAHAFLKAAARISPVDETVRNLLADWDDAQAAADEYDRAAEDPDVIPPIRFALVVLSYVARNLELTAPRDELFAQVETALENWSPEQQAHAARCVRSRYPRLYELDPEALDHLAGLIPEASSPPPPPPAALEPQGGVLARIASWFS
jgi:tetratricopeptide (TPR) repeat protein